MPFSPPPLSLPLPLPPSPSPSLPPSLSPSLSLLSHTLSSSLLPSLFSLSTFSLPLSLSLCLSVYLSAALFLSPFLLPFRAGLDLDHLTLICCSCSRGACDGRLTVLIGMVEVQVEISNPWRYTAIIVARRMTRETRGTGIDNRWDCLLRDRASAIYSSAHNGLFPCSLAL